MEVGSDGLTTVYGDIHVLLCPTPNRPHVTLSVLDKVESKEEIPDSYFTQRPLG